jgi:hypothetical protein
MAVLQQGRADGMCGLYAVLNFLNRTEWKESPADGLWYLLEACRQFGWFTPQYLTAGFEDYQLKAILDLQISNYRLPFETHFVADVASSLKIKKFYDLAVRVSAKKGSIIASWDSRDHWVLVSQDEGKIVRLDSDSVDQPTVPLTGKHRALGVGYGVIILPRKRCDAKIDI